MTLTYVDTSAVIDWLESLAAKPEVKAVECGPIVAALVKDPARTCAISELTIIEALNTVHNLWRNTNPEKRTYSARWAKDAQAVLLEAVEAGHLEVREPKPGDIEHALMMVTKMTEEGRNFRAWDAMHLRFAVEWSREVGAVVELVTSNGDFKSFLGQHSYFSAHVSLLSIYGT